MTDKGIYSNTHSKKCKHLQFCSNSGDNNCQVQFDCKDAPIDSSVGAMEYSTIEAIAGERTNDKTRANNKVS